MDEPKVKALPFMEVLKDGRRTQERYFVDRLQLESEKAVGKLVKTYNQKLKRLNLSGEEVPSHDELIKQGKQICRNYIYTRLKNAGLDHQRLKQATDSSCEISQQIIAIGDDLEQKYPELYRNISRQLNITMSSEEIVKRTYTSVAEHICKGELHWGKVIALFAMAGGFSMDCIVQGHPEYPNKIVDCFGVFIGKHIVDWLTEQGGWGDIITVSKGTSDNSLFWALSGFGAFVGFLLTLMTMVQI